MFIPARRQPYPADDEICGSLCSTSDTTDVELPASPSESPDTPKSDDGWYLENGAHRFVGIVMVCAFLAVVCGVYLYVGKRPRALMRRCYNGWCEWIQRRGAKGRRAAAVDHHNSGDNEAGGEKYAWRSSVQSLYSPKHSTSTVTGDSAAPPRISWSLDKPAPCLKQRERQAADIKLDDLLGGRHAALPGPRATTRNSVQHHPPRTDSRGHLPDIPT